MDKIFPYFESIDDNEQAITWLMSNECNFGCEYCFSRGVTTPLGPRAAGNLYSPQQIADAFDAAGKTWRIQLTGGEPFLYPHFLQLCSLLTKKHRIAINTNASTVHIDAFAQTIDPSMVSAIRASWHVSEREKNKGGNALFFERIRNLQEKRFKVRVDYVMYPALFPRLKSDLQLLRNEGIETVYVKVFRGEFNGKVYPAAYTSEEKESITALIIDKHEFDILSGKDRFSGKMCGAGNRFFTMDEEGNLFRCTSALFPVTVRQYHYGNMFNGALRLEDALSPCVYEICKCPYEGLDFVV